MKTTVIKIALQTLEHIIQNEGVNLETLNIKVQGNNDADPITELDYSKLQQLCEAQLAEFEQEENRLQFLAENHFRVERWNTSPMVQIYCVMDDDDTSIAQHADLYTAIDIAIEKIKAAQEE